MEKTYDVSEIVNDDANFNQGTAVGMDLLDKSIEELGFGRSILLDKNNRVIAGNKSFDISKLKGIKKVRVIETTGDKLVAVKRTDIDLDSKEGRTLAIADNAVALANLQWDMEKLNEISSEFDISKAEWGVSESTTPVQGDTGTQNENNSMGVEKNAIICPHCFCEFFEEEEENEDY